MPRIISWNTQGDFLNKLGASYNALLSNSNDNIIMIQEGGSLNRFVSNQCDNVNIPFEVGLGDHNFNAYFYEQPHSKNSRCSIGMLVEKGGFGINECVFKYTAIGKRPIVTCECICIGSRQEFVFATVHSTAYEKVAKDELNDIFSSFNMQYPDTPWLIMGDFNCQADKLDLECITNISFPYSITHQSGKILDFALYSDSLKGKINIKICSDSSGMVPLSSDHFPIYCEF